MAKKASYAVATRAKKNGNQNKGKKRVSIVSNRKTINKKMGSENRGKSSSGSVASAAVKAVKVVAKKIAKVIGSRKLRPEKVVDAARVKGNVVVVNGPLKSQQKKQVIRNSKMTSEKTLSVMNKGKGMSKVGQMQRSGVVSATKRSVSSMARASSSVAGDLLVPGVVKPYEMRKDEDYMNAVQREHFRNILLHWKNQLLCEAENTVHGMKSISANFADPVDRASQEEEFNLELRARDRGRRLLRKIEEALLRIQTNDYGYCVDCGADIGIRRLEARPTATQCIECKTVAEIREKQIGEVSKEKEEE